MIIEGGYRYWNAGPPLGRLNSTRLHAVGSMAHKTEKVRGGFDIWGVGIVWKGRGEYCADEGEVHEVEGPFFFFVWPGGSFDYGPEEDWTESYFTFSGQRCAEWEAIGWLRRSNEVYPIHSSLEAIHELHEHLLELVSSDEPTQIDCAKSVTEQLLGLLSANYVPKNVPQPHLEKIEALARDWRREPALAVDFEDAAERVEMSYVHFRRKFKEVIGQSPYQYLASQRVAYACRLLLTSRLSVKEVSAQAGFEYTESFNRLFRQKMGQAPKQYRESQYAWRHVHFASSDNE